MVGLGEHNRYEQKGKMLRASGYTLIVIALVDDFILLSLPQLMIPSLFAFQRKWRFKFLMGSNLVVSTLHVTVVRCIWTITCLFLDSPRKLEACKAC